MRQPKKHALLHILNSFTEALDVKFKRDRPDAKWTPRVTAIALLIMVLESHARGYQSLLSTLRSMRPDLLEDGSHESSFCRARKKLTEGMLAKAWQALVDAVLSQFKNDLPAVRGYRLLAIDGVWLTGRRAQQLFRQLAKKKRGRPPKTYKGQPKVLVVCLADALTRMPIAWEFVSPGHGEREAALRLVRHLGPNTILLADRGFPSRKLLSELDLMGSKFIMRMTTGCTAFKEIAQFMSGNGKDRIVQIAKGRARNAGSISARAVQGKPLSKGRKSKESWVLLTNLSRKDGWSRRTILELYHERWAIETLFRELKTILTADRFHAYSLEGIKAELTMTMVAATLMSIAEVLSLTAACGRMPQWNNKHQKRCNRATLATIVRNALLSDPRVIDVAQLLDRELGIAGLRARKRIPDRWYPRVCKSFWGKWKSGFKSMAA